MATGYTTEHEQVEAIRGWWKDNGRSVLLGVVVAVVAIIGWQQWQAYQDRQALAAAAAYQGVLAELQNGDLEAAQTAVTALRDDYATSPYATLGAMRLASELVADDRLEAAQSQLRWVSEQAGSEALRRLGRLRLAQVLLARETLDEALEVLEPVPDGPFAARFQELRGDVLVARSDDNAAIEAYRLALDGGGLSGQRRALIELKLNDLGAPVEPAS